MEISSSTLPAVTAERATMFVALELSKSSWLVALHSPVADKVSLHRFVGGDVAGLLALIARKQTQAEARLGRTIRVLSRDTGVALVMTRLDTAAMNLFLAEAGQAVA